MKEAVNVDKCHWEFTKTDEGKKIYMSWKQLKTKWYQEPKDARVKWSMGNLRRKWNPVTKSLSSILIYTHEVSTRIKVLSLSFQIFINCNKIIIIITCSYMWMAIIIVCDKILNTNSLIQKYSCAWFWRNNGEQRQLLWLGSWNLPHSLIDKH